MFMLIIRVCNKLKNTYACDKKEMSQEWCEFGFLVWKYLCKIEIKQIILWYNLHKRDHFGDILIQLAHLNSK